MTRQSVFGSPDALDRVAAVLRSLSGEAREQVEAAMQEAEDGLPFNAVVMHLKGGAERLRAKQKTYEATKAAAETRMSAHAARMHEQARSWSEFDPHGFYVYVLWAKDDQVLYVGQSTNIFGRLGSHMSDAYKRANVARVTVTRYRTRKAMAEDELRLIRHYKPPLNVAGLRGPAQIEDQQLVDAQTQTAPGRPE